jgi:hypothetical protein
MTDKTFPMGVAALVVGWPQIAGRFQAALLPEMWQQEAYAWRLRDGSTCALCGPAR